MTAGSQTEIDWLLDLARRFNAMVNFQIPQFNPEGYGAAAKNALRDGLDAASKHAQSHSCFSSYSTWLNENRAIFDLQPAILMTFWRNYLRPTGTRAAAL